MSDKKRLAISIGETSNTGFLDPNDTWDHTILTLSDITDLDLTTTDLNDLKDPKIIQLINFEASYTPISCLTPRMHHTLCEETIEKTKLEPFYFGDESNILPIWNHALQNAYNIGREYIPFGKNYKHGEEDTNCRTGAKSLIIAMGLNFNDEFTSSVAGLKAPAVDVNELDITTFTPPPLEEARTENRRLFRLLYDM